jgi:undecaprenyl-diphosphatase
MEILLAIVLGFVQGLTEFLPVSSTGHLILVRELFPNAHHANDLAFDAVLHLATTGAIVIYFWKDLLGLLHTALRFLGRLPVGERDLALLKALLYGTVPAVILGLLLEDLMENAFRSPLLVALVLVLGSALFAYAEYMHAIRGGRAGLAPMTGFKIGLFQALALIPGMSRSGATISGALILGLSRLEAARFAFLLALPVMLGAGGKKLLDLMAAGGTTHWTPIAFGALTAFVVGLGAVHFMMRFMRTNTLWPFVWYRLLLAIFVIALVFFG